eukprot:gnl/Chilomastix_cuspidata/7482.p2 GENE.gnl/Chilomastix_cuspidata/7482~~gnl/Chilomastix_cuspidata/7482.p2  ORF type:complete len:111 (+),score=0.95 gnl/Chilomastix_cuspidata/7482:107-439(+)
MTFFVLQIFQFCHFNLFSKRHLDFCDLDLANKINAWSKCLFSFFPLSGTNFALVRSDKLCGFHFAYEFICVTADVVVVQFYNLYFSFRINNKRTSVGHSCRFDINTQGPA